MAILLTERGIDDQSAADVSRFASTAIERILPWLGRLQGRNDPVPPPVVLIVGEPQMDLLYPPERIIEEYYLDRRGDVWPQREAEFVASGVCFHMTAALSQVLRARFDDDLVGVVGGRFIALCAPRLSRLSKNLKEGLSLEVTTTVVACHELVHWSLMPRGLDERAMGEAVAQLVAHHILQKLAPGSRDYLEFMRALATRQPKRYRGYTCVL